MKIYTCKDNDGIAEEIFQFISRHYKEKLNVDLNKVLLHEYIYAQHNQEIMGAIGIEHLLPGEVSFFEETFFIEEYVNREESIYFSQFAIVEPSITYLLIYHAVITALLSGAKTCYAILSDSMLRHFIRSFDIEWNLVSKDFDINKVDSGLKNYFSQEPSPKLYKADLVKMEKNLASKMD